MQGCSILLKFVAMWICGGWVDNHPGELGPRCRCTHLDLRIASTKALMSALVRGWCSSLYLAMSSAI